MMTFYRLTYNQAKQAFISGQIVFMGESDIDDCIGYQAGEQMPLNIRPIIFDEIIRVNTISGNFFVTEKGVAK